MGLITFYQCTFDLAASDICSKDVLVAVVTDHYGSRIPASKRDANGDAVVAGRYIVVTGVDGEYEVREVEPS